MLNAEQNRRLLQEIDANRRFLLLAYRSNPQLLAREDERLRQMLTAVLPEPDEAGLEPLRRPAGADFRG
ncbi:MAG: hypothetical protein WC023_12905 [Rhodocyclaceae bacterium]|jgi:hypothetical protein